MTDPRWCIDTELNTRFPVYTRFNANDVLPDPITSHSTSVRRVWRTSLTLWWRRATDTPRPQPH